MIDHKIEDIAWEGRYGPVPIQPCGVCGTIVTEVVYYWKPTKQTFCNATCALKAYESHYNKQQ